MNDYTAPHRVSVEFRVRGKDAFELERLAEETLVAFAAPGAAAVAVDYRLEAQPLVEDSTGGVTFWEGTVTASWVREKK